MNSMTDEEILIWYESLEAATVNTDEPEQGIIGKVRELVGQHSCGKHGTRWTGEAMCPNCQSEGESLLAELAALREKVEAVRKLALDWREVIAVDPVKGVYEYHANEIDRVLVGL